MKEIEAPLADLLASGGIPEGSRIWVDVTGDNEFGRDLAFFYERDEQLLAIARERQAKVKKLAPLEMEQAVGVTKRGAATSPRQSIE